MTTGKTYRFQQGLNQWVRVACAVVLLSAASSARAQVADSTDIPLTSIDNDGKSAVYATTPQELQLQDNYRPRENDYLFPKKAWRRMSVGFGAGANWITDNHDTQHQSSVHLNLTYRFTPVHAMRFNLSSVQYRLAPDAAGNKGKAPAIGLGFDYLANLTNFAGGYDPNRYVDLSLVTGVGTRFAKKGFDMGKGVYPYGKMGLQMDVNITKNVGLYVEPYVGLTKKMEQVLGNSIPERWNLFYGIQGGMKASFEDSGDAFAKADTIRRNLFFDTSFGWVSPNMGSETFTKSGVAYQAALGKWMNPMLGFRVGLNSQSYIYSNLPYNLYGKDVDIRREQVMMGARAELMVDLPNAFPRWRDVPGGHNFDMNVLVGGEYGWTRKSHQPGDNNTPGFMNDYYGMTGALQFLYRINNPGTYIFIEPRYLGAFYKNQYEKTGKHVRDDAYSVAIGTRIYITNPSFRPVPRIPDYRHWWMAMDMGGMKWQRSIFFKNGSKVGGINPSVSLSVGYDLARLASFRAQLNYHRLFLTASDVWNDKINPGLWGWGATDNAYDVMDLRLAYMMNLNNLLQGYRADRRYGLWWTVGPSFTYIFNQNYDWVSGTDRDGKLQGAPEHQYKLQNNRQGKVSPGIATSLMAVLALNNKIDLTAEALGQYNFIWETNPGLKGHINNVKYNFAIGTRYHFVPGQLKTGGFEASKFFFDAGLGWTTPTMGNEIVRKSGINYYLGVGKWVHPVLGFRLGGSAQNFIYDREQSNVNGADVSLNREQALLAGRIEAILNPLNFATNWRNKEGGHAFELNLLAGAEYGWNRKSHVPGNNETPGFHTDYKGITAAAQLLYRINNPGTYIFLEPRVLNAHYKDPYYYNGEYKTHDNLYTLSIGTRLYMQNRTVRRAANDSLQSHWWIAADLGGQKWQRSIFFKNGSHMGGINPAVSFSLGYDWKKLASFRAQVSYQRLELATSSFFNAYKPNKQQVTGYGLWDNKYNVMDLRLAYMLNLNNLFQGYDASRRFNFWWTVGPSLTYLFHDKNSWAEGQAFEMADLNLNYTEQTHEHKFSPGLASSFMATMKVADRVDLTAEALGQYNLISGTNPGIRNKINNAKYAVTIGARYHLAQGQMKAPLGDNRRLFFDSSIGWNTPNFKNGFIHQSGIAYNMALGKWFHPVIGARVGVAGQSFLYNVAPMKYNGTDMDVAREEVLLSGRGEVLFNPFNLFEGWRNKENGHDFDLNLFAGGELGWNRRSHVDGPDGAGGYRTKYKGVTAGTQLLYRVSNGTYIFVEPRYLRYNYKTPQTNIKDHDNLYTISIGTRVHLQNRDVRRDNDEFTPNLWMGVDLGGMKWQRSMYVKQGGLGVNPSVSASVGYDWKKLASFRAQLNYQHLTYSNNAYYQGNDGNGGIHYGYGVWDNKYQVLDLRLSYMLNVNNLFQGYKADRKFNLWWTAGPAATYIFLDKTTWNKDQMVSAPQLHGIKYKDSRQGKISPAVYTSLMAQLQVAPEWDITCEAGGQYNFIWGTNPGFKGRINNVKYNLSVGTRYHF